MSKTLALFVSALAFTVLFSATFFSGCGNDNGGAVLDSGVPDPCEPYPPTFTNIHMRVLTGPAGGCSVQFCHDGMTRARDLDFSAGKDQVRARLLMAGGATRPEFSALVVPRNAEQSYLWNKVSRSMPAEGAQMPIGLVMGACHKDAIQQWIAGGALDD